MKTKNLFKQSLFVLLAMIIPVTMFASSGDDPVEQRTNQSSPSLLLGEAWSPINLHDYRQMAYIGQRAHRRAVVRNKVARRFFMESGIEMKYVDSALKRESSEFTGDLVLLGVKRRFKSPNSIGFIGGKATGGVYMTDNGISGGLGYGGLITGVEIGDKPLRLTLDCLFGLGGVGIAESTTNDYDDVVTHYLNRGFLAIEPEVALIISTSRFSSLSFSVSYLYAPIQDNQNLGGLALNLSFLFSRF